MGRDFVLGHATTDLTLFLYGFPFLRSWININDFRATCIGQIKVLINSTYILYIYTNQKIQNAVKLKLIYIFFIWEFP